jgi:hypothetical protein
MARKYISQERIGYYGKKIKSVINGSVDCSLCNQFAFGLGRN